MLNRDVGQGHYKFHKSIWRSCDYDFYFNKIKKNYLFGCFGTQLWHADLWCIMWDLLLWCIDFLVALCGLSHSAAGGILVPWQGIEPATHALQGGKSIALTRQTFAGKVMPLLFNMLSRLVITFLPRSKHLLIWWLQSPSAVILEPPK